MVHQNIERVQSLYHALGISDQARSSAFLPSNPLARATFYLEVLSTFIHLDKPSPLKAGVTEAHGAPIFSGSPCDHYPRHSSISPGFVRRQWS